jgi:hypothetical protein
MNTQSAFNTTGVHENIVRAHSAWVHHKDKPDLTKTLDHELELGGCQL